MELSGRFLELNLPESSQIWVAVVGFRNSFLRRRLYLMVPGFRVFLGNGQKGTRLRQIKSGFYQNLGQKEAFSSILVNYGFNRSRVFAWMGPDPGAQGPTA